MLEIIDLATWAAGAIIAAGLIQWAKGFAPAAPSWVWAAASPLAALAAALAAGGDRWAWNWLGVWACSQVLYETIIQSVKHRIAGTAAPSSALPAPTAVGVSEPSAKDGL